jgi:hypothetical protein
MPGRVAMILLFVPALYALLQKQRRLLASDLLAFALAAWLVIVSFAAEDTDSIKSAIIEAIEFFGAYLIARAYVLGPASLATFIRILKPITIVVILLALMDTLSGRSITMEATGSLFGGYVGAPIDTRSVFGFELVRAQATFDHPILYGTFCALAAAVFLYSEPTPIGRIIYYGLCLFGCLLAASSAPLMSLAIVTAVYFYDRMMMRYSWRWKALWLTIAAAIGAAFLIANYPISWIIAHFTFDPASGYYRVMIWEIAAAQIALSPLTGFGFALFDDPVLDTSVDSIWLVVALRFGLPTVGLLLLANIAACVRSWPRSINPYMNNMRTGFSVIIVMFLFTGLTVHYWNALWMFWGLCLGVRASINEYSDYEASRSLARRGNMR